MSVRSRPGPSPGVHTPCRRPSCWDWLEARARCLSAVRRAALSNKKNHTCPCGRTPNRVPSSCADSRHRRPESLTTGSPPAPGTHTEHVPRTNRRTCRHPDPSPLTRVRTVARATRTDPIRPWSRERDDTDVDESTGCPWCRPRVRCSRRPARCPSRRGRWRPARRCAPRTPRARRCA